jgi:hypothetical protein
MMDARMAMVGGDINFEIRSAISRLDFSNDEHLLSKIFDLVISKYKISASMQDPESSPKSA